MDRVFVGIGFGAIQAGLYLREAKASGAFARTVVALRRRPLVVALRDAGSVAVNIALADGLAAETYTGVEARCLGDAEDRARLHADLVAAHEIAVAVSSVEDYVASGPQSLHRLLAQAVVAKAEGGGPRALIYTSENHHAAAAILESAILSELPESRRAAACAHFQVVDSVIGKMSRVVDDPEEIGRAGLVPALPGVAQAFLVESFNRILIGRVDPARTSGRGLSSFVEKDDLTPFEEAKLHGHNATHAGLAYFGQRLGIEWIADVAAIEDIRATFRGAFLEEAGAALIRRHEGADPLFTSAGFEAHVDDLLARMANPWLRDTCARIGRDARRKLGFDDRLIGTIRLVAGEGLEPRRFALASLAAFDCLPAHPRDLAPAWAAAGARPDEIEAVLRRLEALEDEYRSLIVALGARSRTRNHPTRIDR